MRQPSGDPETRFARAELGRLAGAIALVVFAGTGAELCHLARFDALGIAVVAPALAAVAYLWRPNRFELGVVALFAGLELLLPLQTGGGMLIDWVRHWEIGLAYAGQPSSITAAYLASRTALSEQLAAAFLAHAPAYWVFQLVSLFLNVLWLWPARLLIQREAGDAWPVRLATVALVPFVLYLSVYTWPWAFAAFFLLAAIWLLPLEGRLAGGALGVALAGALLAHPGSLGYALGISAFALVRRRSQVLPALAAGALVIALQLPWVIDVTHGQGVFALVANSDPGKARVPFWVYALTRPVLAVHTLVPFPPLVPTLEAADAALNFLLHSLPGALGAALLLAPRSLVPRGPVAWMAAFGIPFTLLIYPADVWLVGIVEGLFIPIIAVLVMLAASLDERRVRRLLVANAGVCIVFVGLAAWVAFTAPAADPNVAYRASYNARYLEALVGPIPGAIMLLVAAAVVATRLLPGQSWPVRRLSASQRR